MSLEVSENKQVQLKDILINQHVGRSGCGHTSSPIFLGEGGPQVKMKNRSEKKGSSQIFRLQLFFRCGATENR